MKNFNILQPHKNAGCMIPIIVIILICIISISVYAHSGRTDSLGGHNVKTSGTGYEVGTYHYHSGKYAGWIVKNKGDIPDPKKDKYDASLISDGSKPIITPIQTTQKTTIISTTSKPTLTPQKTEVEKTPVPTSTSNKIFNDVNESHWASESIKNLKDKEIIKGYPDGSFKPDEPITRAELCYILNKHYNIINK
jgi:hypothetical protein